MAAAASFSRMAMTPASRTTVLMRLISLSHSRAAASTASGDPARLRASRKLAWAISFCCRTFRGSDASVASSARLMWAS